jgi:hypothetical protein
MKMVKNQKNLKMWTFLLIVTYVGFASAYPTFDEYVTTFGKNYTSEEYASRNQVYDARIQSFANFTLFTPGINNLTDWTESELSSKDIYVM